MLTPIEAAWLAGFTDADGSIGLKKGFKNAKKNQHSLIPRVTMHNTCVVTLNRIVHLILKFQKSVKTSQRQRSKPVHAVMCNVEIMGMKQCEPLLRMLLPHLITKKLEARILLQFIKRRKSRGVRNKPYEPLDYKAHAALAYLKKSRHLRDYTPTVEEVFDQDIVRTSAKALEEAEMSSRLTQEQLNEKASQLVWYRKDRKRPS
jgi:hypothetical protein